MPSLTKESRSTNLFGGVVPGLQEVVQEQAKEAKQRDQPEYWQMMSQGRSSGDTAQPALATAAHPSLFPFCKWDTHEGWTICKRWPAMTRTAG